jgi:RNase P subunit RPR2
MAVSKAPSNRAHEHTAITLHALRQRAGIPYEVERTICADCRRLLDERPLKRAAA